MGRIWTSFLLFWPLVVISAALSFSFASFRSKAHAHAFPTSAPSHKHLQVTFPHSPQLRRTLSARCLSALPHAASLQCQLLAPDRFPRRTLCALSHTLRTLGGSKPHTYVPPQMAFSSRPFSVTNSPFPFSPILPSDLPGRARGVCAPLNASRNRESRTRGT